MHLIRLICQSLIVYIGAFYKKINIFILFFLTFYKYINIINLMPVNKALGGVIMTLCEFLNEEQVVKFAAAGDDRAFSSLFIKYLPKIRFIAKRYYYGFSDFEDVVQEGAIGLFKAVKVYNPKKGVPFSVFASVCIKHNIINASRKYSRFPEILSDFSSDLSDIDSSYSDLFSASYPGPEDLVVGKEDFETVNNFLKSSLSQFEYDVLKNYLTGKKYSEIARALNKPLKSIDNAISRIRQKLNRSFNTS